MKLTRWLLPIFAIGAVFLIATPVLAIADPDSMSIDSVYVYRNCRETGDQLYLVTYNITYSSPPSESVTEATLRAILPYYGAAGVILIGVLAMTAKRNLQAL